MPFMTPVNVFCSVINRAYYSCPIHTMHIVGARESEINRPRPIYHKFVGGGGFVVNNHIIWCEQMVGVQLLARLCGVQLSGLQNYTSIE